MVGDGRELPRDIEITVVSFQTDPRRRYVMNWIKRMIGYVVMSPIIIVYWLSTRRRGQ